MTKTLLEIRDGLIDATDGVAVVTALMVSKQIQILFRNAYDFSMYLDTIILICIREGAKIEIDLTNNQFIMVLNFQ